MRTAISLLTLAVLSSGSPLVAQQTRSEGEAGLRAAAERVASSWGAGQPAGLADLLVEGGVGFHTPQGGRETLDSRMALAALRDLFDRHRTRATRLVRVTTAAGAADRGSAEIAWDAVAPGTSEVLRYTLFVGFVRNAGAWRIYELRVLP